MTGIWTKWESQVVNGVYPLRRFLGRSNHSVVFLTEHKLRNFPNAAIKLIPADPLLAETQLSRWRMVASFSHPHLISLLDAGRCQLGGHPFLYVVMEHAEETLAQVLPRRALTTGEARDLLVPTLDALAFLHRRGLVQGQLKPPNFLVVNDQVKLAGDTIHPAGESAARLSKFSAYDPPEAKGGSSSTAGDIWGLGTTLVEALTQRLPGWSGERSETASLPASLPPEFLGIIRQCLSRNPANRPTVFDLRSQIEPAPQANLVSTAPSALSEAPRVAAQSAPSETSSRATQSAAGEAPSVAVRSAAAEESAKRSMFVPGMVAAVVIVAAAWAGLHRLQRHPDSPQPVSMDTRPSPPAQVLPQGAPPAALPKPSLSAVLHQEIPEVPRSARESVRGRIKVTLRVTVDHSGNVVGEKLQNPGSSRYFAHLAAQAARKWKFAPVDGHDSRVWLLQFEFTRSGATGVALAPHS